MHWSVRKNDKIDLTLSRLFKVLIYTDTSKVKFPLATLVACHFKTCENIKIKFLRLLYLLITKQ